MRKGTPKTNEAGDGTRGGFARDVIVSLAFLVLAVLIVFLGVSICRVIVNQGVDVRQHAAQISSPTGRQGTFTVEAPYTCLVDSGFVPVVSDVAWSDDWFCCDAVTYNHQLARTAMVLSCVAITESDHYQAGSDDPPYMEDLLGKLGFDDCDSSSYVLRSDVLDEITSVATSDLDVVAYSIGTKKITDTASGGSRMVMVIAIRGSYGLEWLSNMKVDLGDGLEHYGFSKAADDVYGDIMARLARVPQGMPVSILITGHSRGGAVANLVGHRLNEAAGSQGALDVSRIYAYTFASPNVTLEEVPAGSDGNIFNIIVPSDLVPNLPLRAWGYGRYGIDLLLPGLLDDGFASLETAQEAAYLGLTGEVSTSDPHDAFDIARMLVDLGERVPSVGDAVSLGGVWSVVSDLLTKIDIISVLKSHYLPTYVSWMYACDESDLMIVPDHLEDYAELAGEADGAMDDQVPQTEGRQ